MSSSSRLAPGHKAAAMCLVAVVMLFAGCAEARSARTAEARPRAAEPGAEEIAANPDARGQTDNSTKVHPSFSISPEQFSSVASGLPDAYRQALLGRPREFLELLSVVASEPEELTWLVDKTNPLPANYSPGDLVELDGHSDLLDLSRGGHRVRAVVMPDLERMVIAAREQGVTLLISSAYRSYEYQAQVYQYWVDEVGQEEADMTSARPGTSQHQLGTVIDFGCICDDFSDQPAGRWLADHAWRYGFSLSFPEGYEWLTGYSFEPWHYRFIGVAAGRMEREFFGGIQQHFVEFMTRKSPAFLSYLIEI